MFVTRATRRDLDEIKEFYDSHEWFEADEQPDLKRGVAFIARQGPIIGCVRLFEIEPTSLVLEDVLVAEAHRGKGVGTQLINATMNSRGGTMYLCCHDGMPEYYERFGFSLVAFEDQPLAIQAHWRAEKAYPHPPDHRHNFMRAR